MQSRVSGGNASKELPWIQRGSASAVRAQGLKGSWIASASQGRIGLDEVVHFAKHWKLVPEAPEYLKKTIEAIQKLENFYGVTDKNDITWWLQYWSGAWASLLFQVPLHCSGGTCGVRMRFHRACASLLATWTCGRR